MGFYLNDENGERSVIEAEDDPISERRYALALYYFVLMVLSGWFVVKLLSDLH